MSQLLLIRNGESAFHAKGWLTGSSDPPLTPRGTKQMKVVGTHLQDVSIAVAIGSVLVRSAASVSIILSAANQIEVRRELFRDLNERGYGEAEGLCVRVAESLFGEGAARAWETEWHTRPPSGETLLELSNRVLPVFRQHILPFAQEKNTILCCHQGVMRVLLHELLGATKDDISDLPPGLLYGFEVSRHSASTFQWRFVPPPRTIQTEVLS